MKQRGFTLLEVIVAFGIFVLVAAALFEAGSTALRLHSKADHIGRATLVAESALASLLADARAAATGSDGECQWRAERTYWEAPSEIRGTGFRQQGAPTTLSVTATCSGESDAVVLTTVQTGVTQGTP